MTVEMKNYEVTVKECDYSNIDDLEAIGFLINAYIGDEMGGGELLDEHQKIMLADELNKHPKSIVLLASVGESRCGMLIAFENFSTFTVKPMINIHDVIVLKERRGKRIGHALMDAVIAVAERRNCSRLTLEVRKDNAIAQHLYKSKGFDIPEDDMFYWRKYLSVGN